jgi:hypothetical protein
MAISRAAMRRHRRGARSRGRPDAGRAIAGGWRTAARASLQHAVGGEAPDRRRFPLITGAASRALRAWPASAIDSLPGTRHSLNCGMGSAGAARGDARCPVADSRCVVGCAKPAKSPNGNNFRESVYLLVSGNLMQGWALSPQQPDRRCRWPDQRKATLRRVPSLGDTMASTVCRAAAPARSAEVVLKRAFRQSRCVDMGPGGNGGLACGNLGLAAARSDLTDVRHAWINPLGAAGPPEPGGECQ